MTATLLPWLAEHPDLAGAIALAKKEPQNFTALAALANSRMNFIRTDQLSALLKRSYPKPPEAGLVAEPIRLAILGSSTTKHLHAGLRVAALRRHMYIDIYQPDYGQYWAELLDPGSALHSFHPNVVLFAFDARHLTRSFVAAQDSQAAALALAETMSHLQACWTQARAAFDATVLQQTVLPVFADLLGQNEHLLPGSPANAVRGLNAALRGTAGAAGVHLIAVDAFAARDGLDKWYSELFWHQAKQEILPNAGPLYGDLALRLIAARYGRSAKCMVLDLDNTIWGGVVGDDGVHGLVLGQGSTEGEAFVAFQTYARELSRRGIILAICSKNDEANALAPFETHPDMVLKRADIACFVANWEDKASNIRRIAQTLNIGIDSLVFVDDNPFERNLVRRELPMVSTPEIPAEPAKVAQCIADAGYFESLTLTAEDRARSAQYQANAARTSMAGTVTDMGAYLVSLEMQLGWARFDEIGLARIAQLVNKSNQFNLTTRRYNEDDLRALMQDPNAIGLQLRLADRFGDNGMIAVLILRCVGEAALIDTWLMSCRVLGRKVEDAALALLVEHARAFGATTLLGQFVPSAKNGMVATHYEKLGFTKSAAPDGEPGDWFALLLDTYRQPELPMILEPPYAAALTISAKA
jgi:FkbH-like protein